MVTISLIAMCGLMGLAVDLGWSFYVHKTARRAADAVAMAAVKQALASGLGEPPYTCSSSIFCQNAGLVACDSSSISGTNLWKACQYGPQNDFSVGGHNSHQNLRIESNIPASSCGAASPPNCVPTAPGVSAMYWVHVVSTETVPQLFSSILGNKNSIVSADSTAAIVNSVAIGSLILINRAGDTSPLVGLGSNLTTGGGPTVNVPGGIILASSCHGQAACSGDYAGDLQGGGTVTAPFTYIYGAGTDRCKTGCLTSSGASSSWLSPAQDGFANLGMFDDPERGKYQPPVLNPGNYIAVPGGNLTANECPSNTCPSGIYYASNTTKTQATGEMITVPNDFSFDGGAFGKFVIFGGLQLNNAVTFGPGEYVLAGTTTPMSGSGGGPAVLVTSNGTAITGGTSASGDAGRLFLLTDSSYNGDSTMATIVSGLGGRAWQVPGASGSGTVMEYGQAMFKSGNNASSFIKLYGLNPSSTNLPASLLDFAPFTVWQDHGNSYVKYNADGTVATATACGGGGTLDTACPNTPPQAYTPQIQLWAGQFNSYNGAIYQPRGAWTEIHSASHDVGALTIVSGAIDIQGSPTLTLNAPPYPVTTLTTALVH
jgi:hypothetical protein